MFPPKNRGITPKMDGENNGSKSYEEMDDLGGKNPYFWFNTHFMKPCQIWKIEVRIQLPAFQLWGMRDVFAIASVTACTTVT